MHTVLVSAIMKENERLGEMVMKNQTILAKDAPAAVGPYSHAVLADGAVCCAGTPEEVYRSGILDRVFGVAVKRVLTEDGWQYYAR